MDTPMFVIAILGVIGTWVAAAFSALTYFKKTPEQTARQPREASSSEPGAPARCEGSFSSDERQLITSLVKGTAELAKGTAEYAADTAKLVEGVEKLIRHSAEQTEKLVRLLEERRSDQVAVQPIPQPGSHDVDGPN